MPETLDEARCQGCGKTPDDLRREGRVPTVRRGPGSPRPLCGMCWVRERPSWHAGPKTRD